MLQLQLVKAAAQAELGLLSEASNTARQLAGDPLHSLPTCCCTQDLSPPLMWLQVSLACLYSCLSCLPIGKLLAHSLLLTVNPACARQSRDLKCCWDLVHLMGIMILDLTLSSADTNTYLWPRQAQAAMQGLARNAATGSVCRGC